MANRYNPFKPGSIITPGMFCGRYAEIKQTQRGLFQTKHGNPHHFVFEGERGIGKSSLFRLLDWSARGDIETLDGSRFNFIVVSVDLREEMTRDDILNTIILELKRQVARRDKLMEQCKAAWDFLSRFEILGVGYKGAEQKARDSDKLDQVTEAICELLEATGQHIDGIFLLIDEAEKPPVEAGLGEMCKLLTERLARRGCERLCIGLAGLPGLIGRLRDSHPSSLRLFSTLPLDPLEHDECLRVIDRGLEDAAGKNQFKTRITDEAKAFIATLSEGYPHFVQEFAHYAFDRDSDDLIDQTDALNGAYSENGALDQLGRKYFNDMFIDQIGSDDYRRVLLAMAESLDGFVSRPEIIRRSGVKERTVDNALKALKDRRAIIQNDRVRGEYRLPLKSFAVWIKARETVRAEDDLMTGTGANH